MALRLKHFIANKIIIAKYFNAAQYLEKEK